jgi:hypothetical protein
MDSKVFWQLNEAYQLGVCNQIEEETLSEEELLGIQEWVEALIEEGYDLDEYTDEELYEAYLEDLQEAKVDSELTPLQKIRKRNKEYFRNTPETDQQTTQRRAEHSSVRGIKNKKGEKSVFGTMRHVGGPYNEEVDLYDIVSEYLISEGFCDSYEDASVIMANMSEEWRNSILDEAVKGSERSIADRITGDDIRTVSRGETSVYKKPNWKDKVETEVRRGIGKEGHKNPYQHGSELTKQAKASAERMNAIKNVEVKHDYKDDVDIETTTPDSKSGYKTVPTDYHARKRRASGR